MVPMRARNLIVATGLVGLVTSLASAQLNTLTPQEAIEGWKLLFDGKSLNGWEIHGAANWLVKDAALACPANAASWLGTVDTYSDFRLRLEFRVPEKANSGVFLRSQKDSHPASSGYELQIWDYRTGGFNTGSLVNAIEATPNKIVPDQWNLFEVTAQGDHFLIVHNGQLVLDGHDSKHASGVIGLQCNADHNPVEFRNIRLLPLPK